MTLDKLPLNQTARIDNIRSENADIEMRLREIGFAEGDKVEVVHRGLFGGSPLAVRLDGIASIAIRPREAALIEVHPEAADEH